jgi:hypothetical protein
MQNSSNDIHIPGKPGPNTESGKAISSKNALKHGLFATHDFIRLGERDQYDAFAAAFRDQLTPEGPLEDLFTTEIIAANWRLHRCRLVEEELSAHYEIDPMQDEAGDKIQRSVDRARAQAQNTIRRALAEIRKLQTERHIRAELAAGDAYGAADFVNIIRAVEKYGIKPDPAAPPDSFCNDAPQTASQPAEEDSFCNAKPAPGPKGCPTGPCPCGSGLEYEECCEAMDLSDPKIAA